MLKKKLRADYKNRRKSISDLSLSNSSGAIAKAALQLPIWDCRYFHIYLSIPQQKEIDTSVLISILKENDKIVVIPKVDSGHSLKHYLLDDTTEFKVNMWNIAEPVEGVEIPPEKIDVVFIPLLAFDQQGNRVGYGKGFYDRFLSECRKDVVKIGLSLFEAEDLIEDVEESDVPLDYCVLPHKTYSFHPKN